MCTDGLDFDEEFVSRERRGVWVLERGCCFEGRDFRIIDSAVVQLS
jgi:hypothetical protein